MDNRLEQPENSLAASDWFKIFTNFIFVWLATVVISVLGSRDGLQNTPLSFLSELCADTLWTSGLVTFGGVALTHLIYRSVNRTLLPAWVLVVGDIAHPTRLHVRWLWIGWLTPWVLLSFVIISPYARSLVCPTPELVPVFKVQQRPGTTQTILPDQSIEARTGETLFISLIPKQGDGRVNITYRWIANNGTFWNPTDCTTPYDTPSKSGEVRLNVEVKRNESIRNFTVVLSVR